SLTVQPSPATLKPQAGTLARPWLVWMVTTLGCAPVTASWPQSVGPPQGPCVARSANAALALRSGSRSVLASAQPTRPGRRAVGGVPASLKCPDANASFSCSLANPAPDGGGVSSDGSIRTRPVRHSRAAVDASH